VVRGPDCVAARPGRAGPGPAGPPPGPAARRRSPGTDSSRGTERWRPGRGSAGCARAPGFPLPRSWAGRGPGSPRTTGAGGRTAASRGPWGGVRPPPADLSPPCLRTPDADTAVTGQLGPPEVADDRQRHRTRATVVPVRGRAAGRRRPAAPLPGRHRRRAPGPASSRAVDDPVVPVPVGAVVGRVPGRVRDVLQPGEPVPSPPRGRAAASARWRRTWRRARSRRCGPAGERARRHAPRFRGVRRRLPGSCGGSNPPARVHPLPARVVRTRSGRTVPWRPGSPRRGGR
jgi:hypothetical protein